MHFKDLFQAGNVLMSLLEVARKAISKFACRCLFDHLGQCFSICFSA